jgi:dipeptidase
MVGHHLRIYWNNPWLQAVLQSNIDKKKQKQKQTKQNKTKHQDSINTEIDRLINGIEMKTQK